MSRKDKNRKQKTEAKTLWILRLFAIFLFATMVLPILILTEYTMDPAYLVRHFVLATAVCFTAAVLFFIDRKKEFGAALWRVAKTPISLALLVFIAVKLISISVALNTAEAVFDIFSSAVGYLFFLVLNTFIQVEEKAKTRLLWSVVLLNIILAGFGFIAFTEVGFNWDEMGEVGSQMVNQNMLAPMFFLFLPFLLLLFPKEKKHRWLLLCLLVVDFLMIGALQNRATYLALSCAALIGGGMVVFSSEGKWNSKTMRIGFVTVVAVALSVGVSQLKEHKTCLKILTDCNVEIHNNYNSVTERLQLWNRSALLFGDNPVLGVGAGNWPIRIGAYGITDPRSDKGSKYFLRPHNELLRVATETGVFGLVAVFGLAFLILQQSLRLSKKENDGIILLSAFIGIGIISLLSFPMERVPLMVLMLALLALINASKNPTETTKRNRGWLLISVIFVSAILSVGYFLRIENDRLAKKMDDARNRKQWNRVSDIYQNLAPNIYNVNYFRVPNDFYAGLASYHKKDLNLATEQFLNGLSFNPNHILSLTNLATCYGQTNEPDSAIFYYQKALQVNPNFESAKLNLAITFYKAGKIELAWEQLLECRNAPKNVRRVITEARKQLRTRE